MRNSAQYVLLKACPWKKVNPSKGGGTKSRAWERKLMAAGLPKEENEMKFRSVVFVLVLVLASGALLNASPVYARVMDSVEVKVRVELPVIQQVEVMEPVAVGFSYPWAGAENAQPLVFENVGRIVVRSNADWTLTIDSIISSGFQVYVRPSGDKLAPWIPANGFAGINGRQGVNALSWDVKIEAPRHAVQPSSETVQFAFTISHM